ncbi:MAG: zinc ribbon domain-containing protein [SAR324 cluster bacterium]|nr:zinc ribbon domain-containing protein [SAR324 cluster bacterium]
MPLYEYECHSCSSSFTELRRSSEMDLQIECPQCEGSETHRKLSAFAVGGTAGIPCATGDLPSACASPESAPPCASNGFS